MESHDLADSPRSQVVHLPRGGQAVINGALVTASESCTLEIGAEAFVLTGRSLRSGEGPQTNPHDELYFSMLEASSDPRRFEESRFRLFHLLSQVVAQDRTREGQKECANCAAALLAGKADDATKSAARLASARLACGPLRPKGSAVASDEGRAGRSQRYSRN